MTIKDLSNNHRKSLGDRRQRLIPNIKYILGGGKRYWIRRVQDKNRGIILDNYHPVYFIYILVILFLSLIDGFFTLQLVRIGAYETIPWWDLLIEKNQFVYIILKYLLTAAGSIVILVLGEVYLRPLRIQVKSFFPAFLLMFILVVLWQSYLIIKMTDL